MKPNKPNQNDANSDAEKGEAQKAQEEQRREDDQARKEQDKARREEEQQRKEDNGGDEGQTSADVALSRRASYTSMVADEANKTPFKPGDVIVGVDYRTITSPEQAITANSGPNPVNMPIMGPDVPPVARSQQEEFDSTMEEVSKLLSKTPHAMTMDLVKEDGVHRYSFRDGSSDGAQARRQAKERLEQLYQNGAYSYAQFAERLRLTNTDIQGILDEDWRDQQGIA
jgi:hypothetical protein